MATARLWRNGVLVESSSESQPLGEELQAAEIRLDVTCPRCERERPRRDRAARRLRSWRKWAWTLHHRVIDLEQRFGIRGVAPDAQMAALGETVLRLRKRLADQELRFAAANERHAQLVQARENRVNVTQSRLNQSLAEIVRLQNLKKAKP